MTITAKYLALDVDGTLCQRSQPPTNRSLRAISQLASNGWTVVLCTGRRFDRTAPILKGAGIQGGHVVSDGAEVVDYPGALRFATHIPCGAILEVLSLAKAAGVTSVFGVTDRLVTESWNDDIEYLMSYGDPEPSYEGDRLAGVLRSEGVSLVYLLDHRDSSQLQQLIEDIRQEVNVSVRRSVRGFATVVAEGVSKGVSLRRLMEADGHAGGLVVAIGDGRNDVPLFETADISVAMAGAPLELYGVATHHAPPIEVDGAAAVMEALANGLDTLVQFETPWLRRQGQRT